MFTQNKKGQLGFLSGLFNSKVLAIIIIIIIGFIVYNNVIKPALEKQSGEQNVFEDHMVSFDGNNCELMNVPAEDRLGYINITEAPNTRAIYRCLKNGDHMISFDGNNCELMNVPAEDKLGYIYQEEQLGTRAIYRCLKNGDHMISFDGNNCELMNVPAEDKLGYIHLSDGPDTKAIYRCFSGLKKGDIEPTGEEAPFCEGRIDSSEILEDDSYGLGSYSLTLINPDEVTIFTQIKEENIGAAPTLIAYKKEGNIYSFINKKDGMQYLVTVELKNANVVGENNCNIDSEKINLRPDPECSLVEGVNLGAGADMESICDNGMYMKSLYQKNIRETGDRLHAEDYKVLCCSETIELKK